MNIDQVRNELESKKQKTNNKFLAIGALCLTATLVGAVAGSTNGAIAFPELSEMANNIGLHSMNGLVGVLATGIASLGSIIRAQKSTNVSDEEVNKFIDKEMNKKLPDFLEKFRNSEVSPLKLKM